MGVYDIYAGEIQLKVNLLYDNMRNFEKGDNVPLNDGIYLGYEGIVVVRHETFADYFPTDSLFDKYGDRVDVKEILDAVSPTVQAVKEAIEKEKSNKKEQ